MRDRKRELGSERARGVRDNEQIRRRQEERNVKEVDRKTLKRWLRNHKRFEKGKRKGRKVKRERENTCERALSLML